MGGTLIQMTWVPPPQNMAIETQHVSEEASFGHCLLAHGNPCKVASKPMLHLQFVAQITSLGLLLKLSYYMLLAFTWFLKHTSTLTYVKCRAQVHRNHGI
jgi:hypothetical protein